MKTTRRYGRIVARVMASLLALLVVAPSVAWADNPVWERKAGAGALDTMATIVDAWEYADTVVLATSDGYWDALAGSGVAGLCQAPVLMTSSRELSPQTEAAIRRLQPATIVVCGGPMSIPDSVAQQAGAAAGGAQVLRLYGPDAANTAVAIYSRAEKTLGNGIAWAQTAFIATDQTYHDALAVSPLSYAVHMPIFLTSGSSTISAEAIGAMKAGGITQTIVVGGPQSVDDAVVRGLRDAGIQVSMRLSGDTAVETSEAVARYGIEHLGLQPEGMGVASGSGYWDALAGGAYCGKQGSVLVLVNDTDSSTIRSFVAEWCWDINHACIFGGEMSVSAACETMITLVCDGQVPEWRKVELEEAAQAAGLEVHRGTCRIVPVDDPLVLGGLSLSSMRGDVAGDEVLAMIALDPAQDVSGSDSSEQGEIRAHATDRLGVAKVWGSASASDLANFSYWNDFDGCDVVLAINPAETKWPSDVRIPVGAPYTSTAHVLYMV